MAITILINGVGGPTPRSIARSLHKYGTQPYNLIGTDINPTAYGLYQKELYQKTYLVPPAGHDEYWETIESIVKENDVEMAIVQPEHEVIEWAKYKENGNEWPCKAFIPEYGLVKNLISKSLMSSILKDIHLVPPSVIINPKKIDFDTLENTLQYPFWIRSASGSSGLGSLKVTSRDSLKTWIMINPKVEEFIASSFLPGRNLACKLLYKDGKLLRAACAERVNYIMSKVAPSGITGNTSFGRLLNEPKLIEKSDEALRYLTQKTNTKLNGFFTADFKEDKNGTPFITEINVRMVAFNLSFAAGGANFSQDIVDLLSEKSNFDFQYKMYESEKDLIFLRDVDADPILMKEKDLKTMNKLVQID
ncbi:ATP-grasp domain-containing protein [Galbibacter mesophilus]|uniref:hypothetical protein n=1 Tax=Galbibacter mesophilus TaxID=379069 RepID=UPI00191E6167|nr:hypothetical protein [Galbibacter mesophilus]MCM5663430.1 hypothetical protein [Galbibacter mesophilus]